MFAHGGQRLALHWQAECVARVDMSCSDAEERGWEDMVRRRFGLAQGSVLAHDTAHNNRCNGTALSQPTQGIPRSLSPRQFPICTLSEGKNDSASQSHDQILLLVARSIRLVNLRVASRDLPPSDLGRQHQGLLLPALCHRPLVRNAHRKSNSRAGTSNELESGRSFVADSVPSSVVEAVNKSPARRNCSQA